MPDTFSIPADPNWGLVESHGAVDFAYQRDQDRLDREWEKADTPWLWPATPQDFLRAEFPSLSARLGGRRHAPIALDDTSAVGATASTFNEE